MRRDADKGYYIPKFYHSQEDRTEEDLQAGRGPCAVEGWVERGRERRGEKGGEGGKLEKD